MRLLPTTLAYKHGIPLAQVVAVTETTDKSPADIANRITEAMLARNCFLDRAWASRNLPRYLA
jgi:hypothetical protein